MILCPDLRLLFTHCAKTGGSSITEKLAPYAKRSSTGPAPEVGTHGWQAHYHYRSRMHSTWEEVRDWAEPLILEDSYQHIAVHRNPWERVASMYHYHHGGKDLSSWLRTTPPEHRAKRHLVPCSLQAGPHVTNWFRFETLEEDWMSYWGPDTSWGLGWENQMPKQLDRTPAKDLYTPDAVEFVRAWHGPDIKLFGYEWPSDVG